MIQNPIWMCEWIASQPCNIGRQFDRNGNLKQWWSDSVIEKFKERAQCIIDQYSNYTVPEVGMNVRL